jgi:acyl carrier protein
MFSAGASEMSCDVFPKLRSLVSDHLRVAPADVLLAASFYDDLQANSLDKVELIMDFEETFGIVISEADADKIITVQNAVDFIHERSR